MESQPIIFEREIDIPATAKRQARKAKLAVRFSRPSIKNTIKI